MAASAVWIPCIFVSVYSIALTTGLSLNNCGGSSNDKTAEVVRGENSSFTCTLDGAESSHTLQWTVNTGTDQQAGTCSLPSTGDSCHFKRLQPVFTPRRTESTRSVMTVDPTKAILVTDVESGTLVCKDQDNSQQDSCPMDYITRASGTCSLRVDTDKTPWTVKGDCNITQGNSTRGRYMCQWFSKKEDNTNEAQLTGLTAMTSNTLPTGSARCPVSLSLPSQDGRYTYRVMFLPGRQFFTTGTVNISFPSTPTITCTPEGHLTENNTLTCTCTTINVGQPAGRLRWLRGSSDIIPTSAQGDNRLEMRQILDRSDDGVTQFRCRLDWSDKPKISTVFTANVSYPPSTSELTTSPSSPSGSVAVSENTTVTFTCRATGGNPPSTVTLSHATSTLRSGPSPLTFDLPAARCEHSGMYTCTGSNGFGRDVIDTASLSVLCSPRTEEQLGPVIFVNTPVTVTFNVIANPMPNLDLTLLGTSEACSNMSEGELQGIAISGSCEYQTAEPVYMSKCSITVYNMTNDAIGIYQVSVTNTQGRAKLRIRIHYNGERESQCQNKCGDANLYFSVAVGLGGVLVLVVIANVVIVVWLRRRQWNLPWAETHQQIRERTLGSQMENEPKGTPVGVLNTELYSSLHMPDVGLQATYSVLPANINIGGSDVSGTSTVYENTTR